MRDLGIDVACAIPGGAALRPTKKARAAAAAKRRRKVLAIARQVSDYKQTAKPFRMGVAPSAYFGAAVAGCSLREATSLAANSCAAAGYPVGRGHRLGIILSLAPLTAVRSIVRVLAAPSCLTCSSG